MKVLALLTPRADKPLDLFRPLILDEEKHLWGCYVGGLVREMYLQRQPLRVSLVFECPDVAAVKAQLAIFPMVEAGLFDVEYIELGPWLQIEALFQADNRIASAA